MSEFSEQEAWAQAQIMKANIRESKINEIKSENERDHGYYFDLKPGWEEVAKRNPDKLPLEAFKIDEWDYRSGDREIDSQILNELLNKVAQDEGRNMEASYGVGHVASGTMICGSENRGAVVTSPDGIKAICDLAEIGYYGGTFKISKSIESMMKSYNLEWHNAISASFQGSDLYGSFHQILITFDHPDGTLIYMASETSEYLDEGVHIMPIKVNKMKRSKQPDGRSSDYEEDLKRIRNEVLNIGEVDFNDFDDSDSDEEDTDTYYGGGIILTDRIADLIPEDIRLALERRSRSI